MITIIGAGIIGLSTAICLQKAGFRVEIITQAMPLQTTSAKAGAIWLPFKVEPLAIANAWSLMTYHFYQKEIVAQTPGISMQNLVFLNGNPELPDWATALPAHALTVANANDLPPGCTHGWIAKVPFIDPTIYLQYLLNSFLQNGGTLKEKKVQSLSELKGGMYINCTGLGAKALTGDKELYPIRGQLVKVEKVKGVGYWVDEVDENAIAYIFPRKDGIILGGTTEPHATDLTADAHTTQRILTQCKGLVPALKDATVLDAYAALRPARTAMRLEWDANLPILHHYGHGGAGFTLCWGAAQAATKLVLAAID